MIHCIKGKEKSNFDRENNSQFTEESSSNGYATIEYPMKINMQPSGIENFQFSEKDNSQHFNDTPLIFSEEYIESQSTRNKPNNFDKVKRIQSLTEANSTKYNLREHPAVKYIPPAGTGYSQFQEQDDSQDLNYSPNIENDKMTQCRGKGIYNFNNKNNNQTIGETSLNRYNLKERSLKVNNQFSGIEFSQFIENSNSSTSRKDDVPSQNKEKKPENTNDEIEDSDCSFKDIFDEDIPINESSSLNHNLRKHKNINYVQGKDWPKERDDSQDMNYVPSSSSSSNNTTQNMRSCQEQKNNSQNLIYIISSSETNDMEGIEKPQKQDIIIKQSNSQEIIYISSSPEMNGIQNVKEAQKQDKFQKQGTSQNINFNPLSSGVSDMEGIESFKSQDKSKEKENSQNLNNIHAYNNNITCHYEGNEQQFQIKKKIFNLKLSRNRNRKENNQIVSYEGKELNLKSNNNDKAILKTYNTFPYLEKIVMKARSLKDITELEFPNLKELYIEVKKVIEKPRKSLCSKTTSPKKFKQMSIEELFSIKEQRKIRNRRLEKEVQEANKKRLSKIKNKELMKQQLAKFLLKNVNLEIFSFGYYDIEDIPSEIWNLKKLKCLVIKKLGMSSLSEGVKNLINLEKLDLSYNKLIELPKAMENLTNLKELSLNGNDNLIEFPTVLSKLPNLNVLNIDQVQQSLWEEPLEELKKINPNLKVEVWFFHLNQNNYLDKILN